ncbi:hypothetical protein C6P45_004065 [Maudiozyma exigua]|uniref:Amino acid transporter transmembrane domain-containing protein n=1 Tax=Maudiozyma exigua TaxID=34358 RepID=A0A9P6WDT7_MAUEX|nr:hypothetical protein C6P45_004065 [Kazachstania exigua]
MVYYCPVGLTKKDGTLMLLSTICSAALLVIPYIYRSFGVIAGLGITLFISVLSLLGLLVQSLVIRYVPLRYASFFSLAQITNPRLGILFDFGIALRCFGSCIIHLIVIRDLIPVLFTTGREIVQTIDDSTVTSKTDLKLGIIVMFIIAPLCLVRSIYLAKYLKKMAAGVVSYFILMLILTPLIHHDKINDLRDKISLGIPEDSNLSLIDVTAILIFVLNSHHHMFAMINEQEEMGFHDVKVIAITTTVIQFFVISIIGLAGYLTFGSNTKENILYQYPSFPEIIVVKIAYFILMILSIPFQCYPLRAALNRIKNWIHGRIETKKNDYNVNEQARNSDASASTIVADLTTPLLLTCEGHSIPIEELVEEGSHKQLEVKPTTYRNFIIYTVMILICIYPISMTDVSMISVLSFIGCTAATLISYILPGIFAYQLIGVEYESFSTKTPFLTTFFKYSGLSLAIIGVLICTIFLILVLPLQIF